MYQISSELPSFIEDITNNILVSAFPKHSVCELTRMDDDILSTKNLNRILPHISDAKSLFFCGILSLALEN